MCGWIKRFSRSPAFCISVYGSAGLYNTYDPKFFPVCFQKEVKSPWMIYKVNTRKTAEAALSKFFEKWQDAYPQAVLS